MAVRKETIKQQFNEALPAVLEPGEQVLGGAYGVSGPNRSGPRASSAWWAS